MLPLLKPVLELRRLLKKMNRFMFITIQETQLLKKIIIILEMEPKSLMNKRNITIFMKN